MYIGTVDVSHKNCWGSETSKKLAESGLSLKVILRDISDESYELIVFCRKNNNKLPSITELNHVVSTLTNYHTIQKCKIVNKKLGILKLVVVDAIGEKGIIRGMDEIKGVNLLPLFSAWIFEDGIEKYWVFLNDQNSYEYLIKYLESDDTIDIIHRDLIDVANLPQINLPNYLNVAIEILEIDESIKKDIFHPIQEFLINTASLQLIDEEQLENLVNGLEKSEHKAGFESEYLSFRLLMELIKIFIGDFW